MIYGIAIDAFYGTRVKRAYVCDHEGDGFFPLDDGGLSIYIKGNAKPNYPMPAIPAKVEWSPLYGGHWRSYNPFKPGIIRIFASMFR